MGCACFRATLTEALAAVRGLACSHAGDIQAAACMDDSVEELQLAAALNVEIDTRLEELGWTREQLVQEVSKTAAARLSEELPSCRPNDMPATFEHAGSDAWVDERDSTVV